MRTSLWRVVPGALLVALLVIPPAAGTPLSGPAGSRLVDFEAEDCEENVPVATAANLVDPGGDRISLDLLVLLDGITKPDAEAIVAKANQSYGPLDVALTATYRKLVTTPIDPAAKTRTTVNAVTLIDEAKRAVGGQRPTGTDLVYLVTQRDIEMNGDTGVVGYADCIGGVRYPTRAFAVGEGKIDIVDLGLRFYVDGPAKTLSHELGHLLGARHDYSNCVQGASLSDVTTRDSSPCTVMTDYVDLQDLMFGSFEAIVVRGHAESFARP